MVSLGVESQRRPRWNYGRRSMCAPTGIIAFMFTDIEGSTAHWEADRAGMGESLRLHDAIVGAAIEEHDGHIFATGGDGFAVAFARASDAVASATTLQQHLHDQEWPGPVLAVRVGIHVGEAEERDGDYFGPVVNLAARVMSAGHGGQVLATEQVCGAADVDAVNLGAHRLKGVDGPVEIRQIGAGWFPSLRAEAAAHIAVPTPRTRLVGRDAEVAEVLDLVGRERLVTLTGAGGVGKTRLAIEVAHRVAARFDDGVWFVDLTPVGDDSGVAGAVMERFGLSPDGGGASPERVAGFLERKRALVIVDNCEHVSDGAARCVDEILSTADRVTIMTTSRELLGIDGEHAWRVPSLPTGVSSPAASLFLERARAIGQTEIFDPTVVDEICRGLDGIPLAIELAAARSASMPLDQIRDRLDDRFNLLGGGRRRRRQQTLEAAVRWSYDLLDRDEQGFLQVLGVFQGGFLAADAAAAAGLDELTAFDLVDALVAKSIVVPDTGGRHRLLETIRLFALDRLVESGRAHVVRDAHLGHFLADPVVQDWAISVSRAGEQRMHEDYENFKAAGFWACRTDRPSEAAVLASALADCMTAHGDIELARGWVDHDDDLDDGQRVRALTLGAHLAWTVVDPTGLRERVAAAAALAGGRPFDAIPLSYLLAANAATLDADLPEAERLMDLALEEAVRTASASVNQAIVMIYRAALQSSMGDFSGTVDLVDRSLALAPDLSAAPVAESARVWALLLMGEVADAEAYAATMSKPNPSSPYRHLSVIARIIGLRPRYGDELTARHLAEQSELSIGQQPSALGDWLLGFGCLALVRGDVDEAREIAVNCLSLRLPYSSLLAAVERWGPDFGASLEQHWVDEPPLVAFMTKGPVTERLLREQQERWGADGDDAAGSGDAW